MTTAKQHAARVQNAHVIMARRLYTDVSHAPVEPGCLVVSDGVILAAGDPNQVQPAIPHDATAVDLGDAVVLPGFVDGHVHLGFDGSDDPVAALKARDDGSLLSAMTEAAGELVRAGVTTARELGARNLLDRAVRDAIDAGQVVGPSLVTAGRPLTTPNGHAWYFGGECADRDAMLDLIRAQAAAGCEWVKLVVSGGFLTDKTVPQHPQFDESSVRAAVEVAHELGMRVAAHSHSTESIRNAAKAGVDTIEHCTFLTGDAVEFDPRIVELLAAKEIAVCPTVNCRTHTYPHDYGEQALIRLGMMRAAGVQVLMGTDAGVPCVPHANYVDGLVMLTSAGMSNQEVLIAATSDAARVLGLSSTTGALKAGMRADVVALNADPLADLQAVRDVRWVMAAGRVVSDGRGPGG